MARQDRDYLTARRALEKYLPEYKKAALAEVFAVPREGDPPTFADPVMNFIAVRASAQAVSGYVESKAAEGETGQALDALGPVFVLGFNLQGNESLINDMVGVAVQGIAFDALVKDLSPAQEASSQDWQRFAQALERSIPPEGQIIRALEADLMLADNTLEDARYTRSELGLNTVGSVLFILPGVLARDQRIYHNNMADLLEDLKRGKVPDADFFVDYGFWSFFTGRCGELSATLIPNFTQAGAQMVVNRRLIVGGAAVAGILAYREEYGRLPGELDKLSKVGVELPEVDFLDYQVEGQKAELLVKIPTETLKAIDQLGRDSGSKWFKWTPEGGRFSI